MQRLTITHVRSRRWQQDRGHAGLGHDYRRGCKSFPVERDEHFCVVAPNIERDAPFSSRRRKNGDGRVCGDVITARLKNGHCWRRGQSTCQRVRSSGSISPTTSRNWNHFAAACNEAARSASRNGRMKLRDDWAWNWPINPRVVREESTATEMPVTIRSLGREAAQVGKIGPAPLSLSRTCPAFPVPLSSDIRGFHANSCSWRSF
jgi:hypothetical protein